MAAKRDDTREKRLAELIERSDQGLPIKQLDRTGAAAKKEKQD